MNTNRLSKLSVSLGALSLCASGSVLANANAEQSMNWLWLYSIPDWTLVALVAILFAGLAWLGLALLRRSSGRGQRLGYYAPLGGALAGILVALLLADPWNAYWSDKLAALPPTAAVPAQPGGPQDLLEEADVGDVAESPKKPDKVRNGRARHAKVNESALDAPSLNLNLFDDVTLTAVRDEPVEMQGGRVWVGHIDEYPGSQVVLAAKGKVLMGTVDLGERFFEIVYVGGNTHAVRELDPNKIPAKFDPDEELARPDNFAAEGDTATDTATQPTPSGDTAVSTGQVIDVMVVYTPKARTNAGGVAGIETKILNAVTRANQAYLNSQINMHLNLVYMGEVAYTETGDMAAAWNQLMNGTLANVQTLRNQYGADQVALIDADANYCGYGTIMDSNWVSTAFAPYAVAVLHDDSVYDCIGSNNSFAHELGHNQGNVHNPESASGSGAYADSYGYRICGAFRDIMAYSCSGEVRIPYFSNPNVLYNGTPTGVAGISNTARSMNATAPIVANFRVSTVPTVPTAPGNLSATASTATTGTVTLRWTDNASNETGYKVESSSDGANWFEVAALSQNAASLIDDGLVTGQTYFYRVYAYNSIGNSAYSNTASATLTVPVPDTTPPVVRIDSPAADAQVSGSVSVKASATDNIGVTGMKLYAGNSLIGVSSSGSLTATWNARKAADGIYTIRAEATDAKVNLGSASIAVRIGAITSPTVPATQDAAAPIVSIKNPADGAVVSGTVTISLSATDDVGVTGMKLLIDAKQVATSTSGSLSFSWNTKREATGSHVIRAEATDASGKLGTASITTVK